MTETKFRKFDKNYKGFIDSSDVARAFSSPYVRYPEHGARMLLRLFTDCGRMDFQYFVEMNTFLGEIHANFYACNVYQIGIEQFDALLRYLNFHVDAQTVQSLYDTACMSFGSPFMSIVSFQFAIVLLRLTQKMRAIYNSNNVIYLSDVYLVQISMWFL